MPKSGFVIWAACLLPLLGEPSYGQAADGAPAVALLQLPRLKLSASQKGLPGWGTQGMQLVALAGDTADLPPYNQFGAQARLGWNAQGIVARI